MRSFIQKLFPVLAIIIILSLAPGNAFAATRTISDAGGNWDATGTWTEGAVPTSADDVVATGTSGALTINAAAAARSVNFTNYVSTVTHNSGIILSIGDASGGSLTFVSGMTYSPADGTAEIKLVSTTSGNTITAAGKPIKKFTVNGSGGAWTLQDNFSADSITLTAGTIDVGAGKTITATSSMTMDGGNITATANAIAIYPKGAFTQNSGTISTVTSGNITIDNSTAAPTSTLAVGSVIGANGATVTLKSDANISDNNGSSINVSSTNLTATAVNDVDLDTSVGSITSVTSGVGAITIDELDAVTTANITSNDGAIIVTAGGTITVTRVRAGGTGRNTVVSNTSGDIIVSLITATGDTVSITAAGSITDGSGTKGIIASTSTLVSAGGIYLSTNSLNVDSVFASTTASSTVTLKEVNSVTIENITTADGDIIVTSAGTSTVSSIVAGGTARNVSITASGASGGIYVNSINASGDTITLNASTSIEESGSDSGADLTAGTLDLNTVSGIGTLGALETSATSIAADSTGAGNIDIDNDAASTVTVTSITTGTSGNILLSQSGGGSLSVPASTTSGDIGLDVTGGNLTLTTVTAGGSGKAITLSTVTSGSVYGNNSNVVTADTVTLSAANGGDIGSCAASQNLLINATTTTSISGNHPNICISNSGSGNLTLGDMTNTAATNIDFNNNLTLGALTISGGALTIGGAYLSPTLNINGAISATSQDISIKATAISMGASGSVSTVTSGNITIDTPGALALRGITSAGTLTIGGTTTPSEITRTSGSIAGTTINLISSGRIGVDSSSPISIGSNSIVNATTTDGVIFLSRDSGDLNLGLVIASGTGRNLDARTTTSGNIFVLSDVYASDDSVFMSAAGYVSTSSATGTIYATNLDVIGVSGIDLNTSVTILNATTTGTGSADIDSASAVSVPSFVVSSGTLDIATTAGDLNVGLVVSNGTVNLRATDALTDSNGSAVNVSSTNLLMTAATGIDLDTRVDSITAVTSATGPINLNETDAVTAANVTTNDGAVIFTAGGTVTATRLRSGGTDRDNTITTTAGDIAINLVTATSDDVILTSAGAITNTNGGNVDVVASTTYASAGGGIDFDATIDNVYATTTAAGDVTIDEKTNSISVSSVLVNNGSFTVTASSTGDVTIDGPIATTGGAINLNAKNNIYQNAALNANGGSGNINLTPNISDGGYKAYISESITPSCATYTVTGDLTINSGKTLTSGCSAYAVTGTFDNQGALKLSGTETLTSLPKDSNSGSVEYTGTTDALNYGYSYYDLTLNNGSGVWTLGSDLTVNNGLTLTQGTLKANGQNVAAKSVSSSNSNTRTLSLGTGTWTLSGTGTVWDVSTATNLTLNASTSLITISDTSSAAKTFAGGGKIYNNLSITGGGSGSATLTGANTWNSFTINAPKTVIFPAGVTQTLSGFSASGDVSNSITIQSSSGGSAATLSKSSGLVEVNYISIQDMAATGGATWRAWNATDVSGNSGWQFIPITPSGTSFFIGGD